MNTRIKQGFAACLALSCSIAVADDLPQLQNAVLHGLEFIAPEDRWAVRIELRQNHYDQTYDAGGNLNPLGQELNGVNLDQAVFPDLAAFGSSASLGATLFEAEVETRRAELTIGYGITSDLTIGGIIPYGKVTTSASFSVNGGNIGFNPLFDPSQPASTTNPLLLPVGIGAAEPVGTEGVQNLLTNPALGFGYSPIESTSWEGFGDPTIGVLWRFYQTDADSLILGTGIRFGVADDVDIDNLLQVPIDDGSTDYRIRLDYYRDLDKGFDLKLAAEYTYQFEDTVTRRVPVAGAALAPASSKENLDRKLGNYMEYDIGLGKVIGDWRVSATWHRYDKQGDRYISATGTDTSVLESNTELYANQWRVAISWSGIRSWKHGDMPLPLIVQLELQETYQALNFPNVRDVYLQLTSFF